MDNSDLRNIREARRLVRQIISESCVSYNELCATQSEQTAYMVLDGQLRIASKLAKLESEFNALQ